MVKAATKKRYLPSEAEADEGRPAVDYHDAWRAHRMDPATHPEPAFEEVEVVTTVAIQNEKKVKVRVAKDQVGSYERVVRIFDRDAKGGRN